MQVRQKSHFKADVVPPVLSFGGTMFCINHVLYSCYAQTVFSSVRAYKTEIKSPTG